MADKPVEPTRTTGPTCDRCGAPFVQMSHDTWEGTCGCHDEGFITSIDRPANDEMVEGYRDGFDISSPEPSDNRSHSYRHGFANGRDDRSGKPRNSAAELRRMADLAMELDLNVGAMERNKAPLPHIG